MNKSYQKTLCSRYVRVLKDLFSQGHFTLQDIEAMYILCQRYKVEAHQKAQQSHVTARTWIVAIAQTAKLLPLLQNFLGLLMKYRRFHLIDLIYIEFKESLLRDQGIKTVTLTTATPLEKKSLTAITHHLNKKTKVRLISKNTPEILGGFILCCDHDMIDLSYAGYIHHLRAALIKG